MKIKIIELEDNDEETGRAFEIPHLTSFVANAVFDKLFDICIRDIENG